MMMLPRIKDEFPKLFTTHGKLKKKPPKRYKCGCGNEFNKTKTVNMGGVSFGIPTCDKCGKKAKESIYYGIWKRMENNQIEQEDFILDVVYQNHSIAKESLLKLIEDEFGEDLGALGHLVYFGYLNVDKEKRDTMNIIEYTLNYNKNLSHRYERIQ